MKSYRNLSPEIVTWYNLHEAWRKARKGKRGKVPAASFEYRLEENLLALQEELANKTYQPGAYHSFFIHEPKQEQPEQLQQQYRVSGGRPRLSASRLKMPWVKVTQAAAGTRQKDGAACPWPLRRANTEFAHPLW